MSLETFLIESIDKLQRHDTKLVIHPKRNLPGNCAGEFEEAHGKDLAEIRVAAGREGGGISKTEWLHIYIHEYSHFLQLINQDPEWTQGSGAVDRFFSWMEKPSKTPVSWRDVYLVQTLENYCDRRAVKLIKYYDLPIDQVWYVKQSNAYTWFYIEVAKRKSWVAEGKKFPYKVKEVLDVMPERFLPMKQYRAVPPKVSELFKKHCF